MRERTPKVILQQWLPHLLYLLILLFIGYFIIKIFLPITAPLILAASISALTYPILFEPFDTLLRKKLPKFSKFLLRQYIAVFSTALLILIALSPCFVLLYSASGSVSEMVSDISAIALGDKGTLDKLNNQARDQLATLQERIPNIPLQDLGIVNYLLDLIGSVHKFAPSFMSFLFKGTGSLLLQFVLTLIGICFFYAHGPKISRTLLIKTALSEGEVHELFSIHKRVILRILNDTVATSICKGLLMAIAVSSFISFPFWLTFFAATLISLLPLIGSTMIWLPMSSLLWSQGEPVQAVILAILCLASNYGVDYFRKKLGQKIYASSQIVNFFIFMSVIGGIFSFGIKGLIIGPICIIFALILGSFWFGIYRNEEEIAHDGT